MTLAGQIVYLLCAVASLACVLLLARGYARSRARILLWSMACFVLMTINNLLLFLDLVIFPTVNLSPLRDLSGVLAVAVLVVGLLWETG